MRCRWSMMLLCLVACEEERGLDGSVPTVDATEDAGTSMDVGEPPPDAGAIPRCTVTISEALSMHHNTGPTTTSNAYLRLSPNAQEGLRNVTNALIQGDSSAFYSAQQIGYSLCLESETAMLIPRGVTGQAALVLRLDEARPVVAGVPHPYYELGTMEEAIAVFEDLDGRAIIISGTHRCANTLATSCDGNSSVCTGQSAPYKISDMAHQVDTAFQIFHEVLATAYNDAIFLSLHGMSSDGVILSDGTSEPTDPGTLVARFTNAITLAYPGDPISVCNDYTGATLSTRLCGTTNLQGRLLNGSAEPCNTSATTPSGRFLHLEQSRAIRQQISGIVGALDQTVPR